MKKLSVAVMFVIFLAGNVFAFDWYAGTALKYTSLGGDDSGSSFMIAPEIARIFSDKIDAGVGFSYTADDTSGVSTYEYEIIPFVRYKAWESGNFAFYTRGQVSFGSSDDGTATTDTFGIAVLPVVEYALSDRFTLFVSFGEVAYKTAMRTGYSGNEFSVNLDINTLVFGFCVNF
ncbi:MAG: hypothetical protein FWG57_03330 [Endomicrobia bacterium]|nr:hypothetical protein [Endomicrobiia bacterium]